MGLPEFLHKIDEETEDPESIPYSTLSELSGLGTPEAQELIEYLGFWNPEQVRELYARLTSLIESDLQMEFDCIFLEGLQSDDDVTRSLSVTGLAESTHPSLLRQLMRLLRNDDAEDVRIASALGLSRMATLAHEDKLPARQAVELQAMLTESFNDELEVVDVRRRSLEALAVFQGEEIEAYIEIGYEESEDDEEESATDMRQSAIHAMGRNSAPRWIEIVIEELDSANAACRFEAAIALGQMGNEEHLGHLLGLMDDDDIEVQTAAVRAMGFIGGTQAQRTLRNLLTSTEPAVVEAAKESLSYVEVEDMSMFDQKPQTVEEVSEEAQPFLPEDEENLYIDDTDLEQLGFVSPGERDTSLDWVGDDDAWEDDPLTITDEDLGTPGS
ncbi:MAG: HEAT repeat domain-containing protein [Chloroflexi bacterium]|nr:HEAT repeat domain-containing protein [Chloroflexota bacterium]MBT4073318.1 HEAT repeat domain-containing protein [Chloroflexota bacterium]MBT4514566.1 HEAT repeat domain-containing protein [Chloroflexota bacterium]MBT5319268.1 HEAT repeat domain-containing protein [Chloroflexota bacterium]MBT6682121.1 HEAT repeat domain-containing protein [Chloroflexota bacterium]